MKKYIFILIIMLGCGIVTTQAQKYYTKNGTISFFSKTNMEDIKAENNQVMSVLNVQTGELQFSLLVKGFHFEKALMEEHFNENYLESEKFPKSTFKGLITDIAKVNFLKDGNYPVNINGDLNMHGVSNKINVAGTIYIKEGAITGKSVFKLVMTDYKVIIPKLVENNISKTIEITVDFLYNKKM